MGRSSWGRRLACVGAAGACATVVAVSGELSTGALVAVMATGAVVTGLGLRRQAGAGAAPVGRSGLPWLVWLAAVVAWEFWTLADRRLPTLSDLADPALAHPPVRGLATLGWLLAGTWLVTRPRPKGYRRP